MTEIDNHLVMVELVGPRLGQPTGDAATTLPFQREELTEKVLRVAAIEDETVPYTPVELDALAIQPSEPYALIEVKAIEPMRPIAIAASANLVATDLTPTRRPRVVPRSRSVEALIAIAFLVGALGAGIGLAFLIAAVAR